MKETEKRVTQMHGRTRNRGAIVAAAMLAALALIPASPASASLVAPGSKCRGQQNTHASKAEQKHAMLCLLNYARKHAHAGHLKSNHKLERAAGRKAGDVMHCGFSHEACGRPGDFYAHQFGYTSSSSWAWGENLAWGQGKGGTARGILKQWLNSPPHRETMLRGEFEHAGIGIRVGGFNGHHKAAVWVLELGCHGC
jgi:uncharacterized protein YkwD